MWNEHKLFRLLGNVPQPVRRILPVLLLPFYSLSLKIEGFSVHSGVGWDQ